MCIPDVTLPRLKAFIPQLLSRLHIEALLHGNITKEVGFLSSLTQPKLFFSSVTTGGAAAAAAFVLSCSLVCQLINGGSSDTSSRRINCLLQGRIRRRADPFNLLRCRYQRRAAVNAPIRFFRKFRAVTSPEPLRGDACHVLPGVT